MQKFSLLFLIALLNVSSSFSYAKEKTASSFVSMQTGIYHYSLPEIYALFGENGATVRMAAGKLWQPNSRLKVGAEVGMHLISGDNGVPFYLFRCQEGRYKTKRYTLDAMSFAELKTFWGLHLFANAGASYAHSTYSQIKFDECLFFCDGSYTSISGSYGKIVPKLGLGMSTDLTPTINLNMAIQHEFSAEDASAFLIGIRYNFG